MYHIELRQFPHNAWSFNLTEPALRAVVEPWVRQQLVEVGERKWSPHQAKLTILEGPELEVQQLAMGRGWRTAQRQGEDVTERVLAAARDRAASAARAVPQAPPAEGFAQPDPLALGVQLAALLGHDPGRLLAAWRDAAARSPELVPSQSLAQAERAVRDAGGQPR
jgi:hypothetical protein